MEEGPFPWALKHQPQEVCAIPAVKPCTPTSLCKKSRVSWQSHIRETMRDPHTCSMMEEIEEHDKISLWLPIKTTTAGAVLQHSLGVMDTVCERHAPMIYKFGFSCNPIVRWENRRYGYMYMWENCKWQHMIILFISKEPWSPAMLEAALIDRYYGFLLCFSGNMF